MKRPSPRCNRFNSRRLDQQFEVRWGVLVCVLPYLLLALFGQSLHSHAPQHGHLETITASRGVVFNQSHVDSTRQTGQAVVSSVSAHPVTDAECLMCLWASSSIGVAHVLPQGLHVVRLAEVRTSPLAVVPVFVSLARPPNRGPPLS